MSRDVPHNLTPDARHKLSYDVPYSQVHDIHQLHNLSLDEPDSLSHDEPINTSQDTLLSSGSLEEVKEDSPSGHQGRKITRRSSLMSQASVKKLFKWKNRQENKRIFCSYKLQLSCRSSDRRVSAPTEFTDSILIPQEGS